ncbi:MAG TPA: hypothetical protein VE196_03170 [Pseudonocardiaceae bacterium]|nr:hypothetical protein [Pseudonocardiaceae bacterium]
MEVVGVSDADVGGERPAGPAALGPPVWGVDFSTRRGLGPAFADRLDWPCRHRRH